MSLIFRVCVVGLVFSTASFVSPEAWAAFEAPSVGEESDSEVAAHHPAKPAHIPELLVEASDQGNRPVSADADADGIADPLEVLIDAAGPGETFDVIAIFDRLGRASERAEQAAGPFRIEREFGIVNGFQARMTGAQIRALGTAAGLIRVEENGEVQSLDAPSNRDAGVTSARDSFPALDGDLDGSGVTVCIIDTGINTNHEQFDPPGIVADFIDFTSSATQPYDDNGHGTHVAGILAGDGTGGSAYSQDAAGVAPDVSLMITKVLDSGGSGSQADVISAIEWCAGADIVSMSLGSNPTDGLDPTSIAVNCASDPGYDPGFDAGCDPDRIPAVYVIAAGNSGSEPGTTSSPGVAEYAITAGSFAEWSAEIGDVARDEGVYLNPYSGRGPVQTASGPAPWLKPDVAGPGSRVLSAYIDSSDPTLQSPDSYAVASGTSMATPFVAGVIALMFEADPTLGKVVAGDERLPHEKVRQILADTSVDVGPGGPDHEYGHGLIDALAAVANADGSGTGSEVTEYPLQPPLSGSVGDFGEWTYSFEVAQSYVDAGLPLAAMLTIEGECVLYFGLCAANGSWWDPDLEIAVEYDTGGGNWQPVSADPGEVTVSECPAFGECHNSVGRTEVVHFTPDHAGFYRMRVWPFGDWPNDGAGGSFTFELSVAGAVPTGNVSPNVVIESPPDGWAYPGDQTVTFVGTAADDEADLSDSISWSSDLFGGLGTGSSVSTSELGAGSHRVTASVTGSDGDTGSASVEIIVQVSAHVADLDDASTLAGGRWDARVNIRLMDDREPAAMPVQGASVSGSWDGGLSGSESCVTDGQGWCTVTRSNLKKNVSGGTFTVEDVSGVGISSYASGANTDPDGDSNGTTIQIVQPGTSSNQPPSADFVSSCGGLECQFVDLSNDSDGSVTSWTWEFGDLATSTQQNPIHTYGASGTYTVALTVTDDAGATNTKSQDVSVSDGGSSEPPQPEEGPTLTSAVGYKVKGEHTIDLKWTGAVGDYVTVYREGTGGAFQEPVPNGGAYTHDTGNKGGGQYDFWICEDDGSPCSGKARVIF